jgi:hypothetical protein
MSTHTGIHDVKQIGARALGSMGAPLTLSIIAGNGHETEITLYTDSLPLSRRLAALITEAVMQPLQLSVAMSGVAEDLADVLAGSGCSLDEAKAVLRAALSDYENHLEEAWQAQQEQLSESGGRDDSSFRKNLIDAGRGHLLR